ncbi:MAG TPA: hypothetical protein VFP22_10980, partial [Candidatus Limnocylindrales bacterium]|nr:hypothetical protein [Candidatus Limnocylindrales bacterium]
MGPTRNATPLARAVDLSGAWNASDDDLAARFHPVYGAALARLPDGAAIFRGLPFALGRRDGGNRWLLVREPITIDLPDAEPASHVVVAHFSDSWRDDSGRRPPGMAVGWVAPAGEELARYELELADGGRHEVVIRRRFEVADGIIGWGVLPFDAIGHRSDEPIDWRGPHARLTSGRYPRAGDAGLLAMLPGSWGPAQTSVADYVPTPDDDITYWLHAIPVAAENGGGGDVTERAVVRRLHVQPLAGGRQGSDVVIAAITLFRGTADPLVVAPRRQVLVTGWSGGLPAIDLGVAIAARPLPARGVRDGDVGPIGWGSGRDVAPAANPRIVVDLAIAPDGRVAFGDLDLSVADLDAGAASGDGGVRVTPLAAADVRTTVRITADGTASPARVRFVAADGRYLPPLGHREEINPGLFEDSGAGLLLGGETFAYVPGQFQVDLPPGPVTIEIVKGFEHRPIRREAVVDPAHTSLDLALERAVDLRPAGWWSSDAHVHFIAPTTALLQAAAE